MATLKPKAIKIVQNNGDIIQPDFVYRGEQDDYLLIKKNSQFYIDNGIFTARTTGDNRVFLYIPTSRLILTSEITTITPTFDQTATIRIWYHDTFVTYSGRTLSDYSLNANGIYMTLSGDTCRSNVLCGVEILGLLLNFS